MTTTGCGAWKARVTGLAGTSLTGVRDTTRLGSAGLLKLRRTPVDTPVPTGSDFAGDAAKAVLGGGARVSGLGDTGVGSGRGAGADRATCGELSAILRLTDGFARSTFDAATWGGAVGVEATGRDAADDDGAIRAGAAATWRGVWSAKLRVTVALTGLGSGAGFDFATLSGRAIRVGAGAAWIDAGFGELGVWASSGSPSVSFLGTTAGAAGLEDEGVFGAIGSGVGAGDDRRERVAAVDGAAVDGAAEAGESDSLRFADRVALTTFGSLIAFDEVARVGEFAGRVAGRGAVGVESPILRTTLLDELEVDELEGVELFVVALFVELVELPFAFAELLSPSE